MYLYLNFPTLHPQISFAHTYIVPQVIISNIAKISKLQGKFLRPCLSSYAVESISQQLAVVVLSLYLKS